MSLPVTKEPRSLLHRFPRGPRLQGGFQALPYDPDFERTMEIADELMDRYRDTLAALAK